MNLFQKKIEPRCAYCARGHSVSEDQVLCPKKRGLEEGSHCRSFK